MPAPEPSWRFYLSPHEAWDAMYQDCQNATQSIELEQYIIENERLGQKFLQLFIEKAKQGVNVFVICDYYGSQSLAHSVLVKELGASGGQFHFYHALGVLRHLWPKKWFPRTHIKTLLVDSSIAYTGGVCLAERMENWRDTQIRITGRVTIQVKAAFNEIEKAVTHRAFTRIRNKKHVSEEFSYLQTSPISFPHRIYRELISALGSAEHHIYLCTAFFAPNRRFRRTLMKAQARGVRVVLLVPMKSDIIIADWLCLSYASTLLKAGVEIFRYKDRVLHAKTVVIDNDWATVGSTNMDILSFFLNREANLIIKNRKAVAELEQQFLRDIGQSERLTLERLEQRPFFEKIIGYLARILKAFLWRS